MARIYISKIIFNVGESQAWERGSEDSVAKDLQGPNITAGIRRGGWEDSVNKKRKLHPRIQTMYVMV